MTIQGYFIGDAPYFPVRLGREEFKGMVWLLADSYTIEVWREEGLFLDGIDTDNWYLQEERLCFRLLPGRI